MTVKRLRPLPTDAELAAMYPTPHDHRLWGQGHHDRVEATIQLAREQIPELLRMRVADLSCGNGVIARSIHTGTNGELHLGDLAVIDAEVAGQTFKRHPLDVQATKYCGPIEETIHLLPPVEVFVCSETIEHLDDPGKVLAQIRVKADWLVLSTPVDCWDDSNPEHLWAWDRAGVEDLALRSSWRPVAYLELPTEAYTYGIWVMS